MMVAVNIQGTSELKPVNGVNIEGFTLPFPWEVVDSIVITLDDNRMVRITHYDVEFV